MNDDAALIKRAQGGNQAALTELYERHWPTVLKVAGSKVAREAAEDVAMEAMTAALVAIGSYTGKGSFEGWLVRIAQRKGIDWLRKEGRTPTAGAKSLEHFERNRDFDDDDAEDRDVEDIDAYLSAESCEDEGDIETVMLPAMIERKPDELTTVPMDKPGIAAMMFLAALAWPEMSPSSHAQRDRCMHAMSHLAERRGRELGYKSPNRLTMTPQQQRGALRMMFKRLNRRLEAASVAMFVMVGMKRPDFNPWTVGAVARSKRSRASWYRDSWTATLPVLHLAWKFRGLCVRRHYYKIDNNSVLDMVLDSTWVSNALPGAEKLANALPRVAMPGQQPLLADMPAQVRLIPDR